LPPRRKSTTKGFKRTSSLLQGKIRSASEARGFAVTRLLTHWTEIMGEDIAAIARPVDIKYGRQGFGATLTVLTTGAQAVMLEMQKESMRERVNATYGYNAIARVRITQTSATGFSEGRANFQHHVQKKAVSTPDPELVREAKDVASPISDEGLRAALEALGRNVLSKSKHQES
jgi:hypothetical protein